MTTVDLFAGPGGWDEGARLADIEEPYGIECEADPVATAIQAGHRRRWSDVLRVHPGEYTGARGLIASPPCQGFSTAGLGFGRRDAELLVDLIRDVHRDPTEDAIDGAIRHLRSWRDADDGASLFAPTMNDQRSALVLEPLRWAIYLRPAWIALEQVPAVLPIWHGYVGILEALGYTAEAAVLSTECYGVPQTRRRAILVARDRRLSRRLGPARMPRATHSRYYSTSRDRVDPGVLPWVSMADALGWPADSLVGFPRLADDGDAVTIDGTDYRARDLSPASVPAQTVTEKARSWVVRGSGRVGGSADRPADAPAPTITAKATAMRINDQSGTPRDAGWPYTRPATTIAGRDLVADPGTNANRFNESTKSRNDGVRVTVTEAGILQGFRPDYPWQGSDSSRYQQIGDAVPPPLATAVLLAVTGAA